MIRAEAARRRPSFPAGWYGKVPAAGDFVARRVPGAFCEAWDRWLQAALDGARLRVQWPDDYLSMPVWRFVLSAGLVTPSAWAGVMAPSVDAVGRYFPLAMASALPLKSLDLAATLFAAQAWFDDMEEIAVSAVTRTTDVATLDTAIAARPFRDEWLRFAAHADVQAGSAIPGSLACVQVGTACRAAWLAEATEMSGRTLAISDGLPSGDAFCALVDGRWLEHGWLRRTALPGG